MTESLVDPRNCPYYRGVGTCESGCWDEPHCITDEPLNGWASVLQEREPAALDAPEAQMK